MTAAEFQSGIMDWLRKYNFTDTVKSVGCRIYSSYNMDEHEIHIGTEAIANVGEWFNEFLEDHGLEWKGIPSPVLQFLHELGHSQTIYEYSEVQLILCGISKDFLGPTDTVKENAIRYWEIPDELDANNWLIYFANHEIDAMNELCQFFIDNWEDSIQDMSDMAWDIYTRLNIA